MTEVDHYGRRMDDALLRCRELAEVLEEFHRYSVNGTDGYAGSPFEGKVRALLEQTGVRNLP